MAKDLKDAFPEMSGFSPRNIKYMRKFAESWPDFEIVQQVVAQIPWRTNRMLLDKLHSEELRDYCGTTKARYLEVLEFTHFVSMFEFNGKNEVNRYLGHEDSCWVLSNTYVNHQWYEEKSKRSRHK